MKYLLSAILLAILSGCDKCPSHDRRDYHYEQKVKVIAGFYKGQTGHIESQNWVYRDACSLPGYMVRLYSTGEKVSIDQFSLYAGDEDEN